MFKLNNLKFNEGTMKARKRVARGNSGKATGRGFKGQKARSGVSLSNFQGGQTPLERRLPKQRTFYTPKKMKAITIKQLNFLIANGLIQEKDVVNSDLLTKMKLIKNKEKYKVIGSEQTTLTVEANAFSVGAKKSIEAKGSAILIK